LICSGLIVVCPVFRMSFFSSPKHDHASSGARTLSLKNFLSITKHRVLKNDARYPTYTTVSRFYRDRSPADACIRWLACLAGAGVPPAGINDLARPHSPIFFFLFSEKLSRHYLR
jgi:hypothetical protein